MKGKKSQSDTFLLSEIRDGKENAFDFIFRKHYKSLCVQASLYVNDFDKAQSLVQECFIRFWEKREEIEKIETLSAYLSTMVRNRCIDYLRVLKRTEEMSEKLEERFQISNSEELLLKHEFEEKLLIALSAVPERSRIAFEFSRFENLAYSKIAEKMGISVKAVEALISRALKILRNELKEYLPVLTLFYLLKL